MVSHELKTPLTSLKGYLQVMQRMAQKSGESVLAGVFEKPLKQVSLMTTMINGFLNMSRLDAGKIHIEKTKFDMAELVYEAREENIPLYSSHLIVLGVVEQVMVEADRAKIAQVINNLLSNAAKYSPVGTSIELSCQKAGNKVQISVKDQGLGIRAEDLDKLFERYYRVEHTSNISGFGIGLYLSAEIVARHGGKIWAESDIGLGSTFYFEL
jgi:signal transduction histidine kinase